MNSAARVIQRGWRRTATRLGRLGESANENRVNYSIMKNVPLKTLHQILLRIAQKSGQNWKYHVNNNGHMIYSGGPENVRLNRQHVIYNIALLTNIRPNARKVQAARVIQAHSRGARARREVSFRRTPFGKALPRNVLNTIFRR
jgi:hypothetical protein